MRKMKRLITLLMTVVMMMAMSLTAFADEQVTTVAGPTIKVTNISDREGKGDDGADFKTHVAVYKLAVVDKKTNTVKVESWAEREYSATLNDEFKADGLYNVLAQAKRSGLAELVGEADSTNGSAVEFTGLPAGAYAIQITGKKVVYSLMVAVTYDVDDAGNYVAKADTVVLKAKGTTNHVDKVADDKFVKAGDIVPFKITTTVPYNVKNFSVFDVQKNLADPENLKVTVADKEINAAFVKGETDNDGFTTYEMNLDSLVINDGKVILDNAGAKVVITYTATVIGADGFVNQAYDSTEGNKAEEIGITAKITLTKLNENNAPITGEEDDYIAEFEVTDDDDNTLTFKYDETAKVYVLSDAQDAKATIKTDKTTGKVTVAGLEEGKYFFKETKAPKGYSINTNAVSVEVKETDKAAEGTRVVPYTTELQDTTLIQLPFTGGMGTTIFTILGVAIMAMAAALFFATKKSR